MNIKEKRELAIEGVHYYINNKLFTKGELADLLDMSNPTLKTRLNNNDWRPAEIEIILTHCQM